MIANLWWTTNLTCWIKLIYLLFQLIWYYFYKIGIKFYSYSQNNGRNLSQMGWRKSKQNCDTTVSDQSLSYNNHPFYSVSLIDFFYPFLLSSTTWFSYTSFSLMLSFWAFSSPQSWTSLFSLVYLFLLPSLSVLLSMNGLMLCEILNQILFFCPFLTDFTCFHPLWCTLLYRVRAAAKISAGGVGSPYNQLYGLWIILPLVLTTVMKISSVE